MKGDPGGGRCLIVAPCELAPRQGGRTAIHCDQVDIVNETFSSSELDVARARRIVARFEEEPEVGAIGFDVEMLDISHLNRTRRLIAMHELYAGRRQ
jgi:citrate lyase subunit beta / citryl-CoA lyase